MNRSEITDVDLLAALMPGPPADRPARTSCPAALNSSDLALALQTACDQAWGAQFAGTGQIHRAVRDPLDFQQLIIELHRSQTANTARLYALVGAATANLNLDDPDQYALYLALNSAAVQGDKLDQLIRDVAAHTIDASNTAAADIT